MLLSAGGHAGASGHGPAASFRHVLHILVSGQKAGIKCVGIEEGLFPLLERDVDVPARLIQPCHCAAAEPPVDDCGPHLDVRRDSPLLRGIS